MAEQQTTRNYDFGKFAVMKSDSSEYGDCAIDFYDSLRIGKIRLNMINKKKDKPSIRVEHYFDVDEFLVIATDVISGDFKETAYGATRPKKRGDGKPEMENGKQVFEPILGKYIDRKGGPKKDKGKAVYENGKPVYEARVLTITYEKNMRIPYKIEIEIGKGEKIGAGAVKMVGQAERKCGIRMTEFQMRALMKKVQVLVEHRFAHVWMSENVADFGATDEDANTDQKLADEPEMSSEDSTTDESPNAPVSNEPPVAEEEEYDPLAGLM